MCGQFLQHLQIFWHFWQVWLKIWALGNTGRSYSLHNLVHSNAGLWIRIRIGSDSVTLWIRIRIRNTDPGARKLRNFSGKMHFLVILPLKRYWYKIALTTFWKKFSWTTPIFLIWFDSNLDFRKIWERNCLRKFCFSLDPELDPDPDWAKMLDPDPY
jgi:hypothetical protein